MRQTAVTGVLVWELMAHPGQIDLSVGLLDGGGGLCSNWLRVWSGLSLVPSLAAGIASGCHRRYKVLLDCLLKIRRSSLPWVACGVARSGIGLSRGGQFRTIQASNHWTRLGWAILWGDRSGPVAAIIW